MYVWTWASAFQSGWMLFTVLKNTKCELRQRADKKPLENMLWTNVVCCSKDNNTNKMYTKRNRQKEVEKEIKRIVNYILNVVFHSITFHVGKENGEQSPKHRVQNTKYRCYWLIICTSWDSTLSIHTWRICVCIFKVAPNGMQAVCALCALYIVQNHKMNVIHLSLNERRLTVRWSHIYWGHKEKYRICMQTANGDGKKGKKRRNIWEIRTKHGIVHIQ